MSDRRERRDEFRAGQAGLLGVLSLIAACGGNNDSGDGGSSGTPGIDGGTKMSPAEVADSGNDWIAIRSDDLGGTRTLASLDESDDYGQKTVSVIAGLDDALIISLQSQDDSDVYVFLDGSDSELNADNANLAMHSDKEVYNLHAGSDGGLVIEFFYGDVDDDGRCNFLSVEVDEDTSSRLKLDIDGDIGEPMDGISIQRHKDLPYEMKDSQFVDYSFYLQAGDKGKICFTNIDGETEFRVIANVENKYLDSETTVGDSYGKLAYQGPQWIIPYTIVDINSDGVVDIIASGNNYVNRTSEWIDYNFWLNDGTGIVDCTDDRTGFVRIHRGANDALYLLESPNTVGSSLHLDHYSTASEDSDRVSFSTGFSPTDNVLDVTFDEGTSSWVAEWTNEAALGSAMALSSGLAGFDDVG